MNPHWGAEEKTNAIPLGNQVRRYRNLADLRQIQEFVGINVLAEGIFGSREDKSPTDADQDNQTDETVNLFHDFSYNLAFRKKYMG